MSTYQIVLRSTALAFRGFSVARLYERFADWWVTLYCEQQRPPRTYL